MYVHEQVFFLMSDLPFQGLPHGSNLRVGILQVSVEKTLSQPFVRLRTHGNTTSWSTNPSPDAKGKWNESFDFGLSSHEFLVRLIILQST